VNTTAWFNLKYYTSIYLGDWEKPRKFSGYVVCDIFQH